MKDIVILDTGCCNLTSLLAAVKRLGVEPIVTAEPAQAKRASRLFLPGVGTAQAAMRELQIGIWFLALRKVVVLFWVSALECSFWVQRAKRQAA